MAEDIKRFVVKLLIVVIVVCIVLSVSEISSDCVVTNRYVELDADCSTTILFKSGIRNLFL